MNWNNPTTSEEIEQLALKSFRSFETELTSQGVSIECFLSIGADWLAVLALSDPSERVCEANIDQVIYQIEQLRQEYRAATNKFKQIRRQYISQSGRKS